jgi:hypothetical protein
VVVTSSVDRASPVAVERFLLLALGVLLLAHTELPIESMIVP